MENNLAVVENNDVVVSPADVVEVTVGLVDSEVVVPAINVVEVVAVINEELVVAEPSEVVGVVTLVVVIAPKVVNVNVVTASCCRDAVVNCVPDVDAAAMLLDSDITALGDSKSFDESSFSWFIDIVKSFLGNSIDIWRLTEDKQSKSHGCVEI